MGAKVKLLKLYPADQEDSILLKDQSFTADKDAHRLDLFGTKPELGTYTAEVEVTPTDKQFSAIKNSPLNFNVVGTASIADTVVTVATSDDPADIKSGKKYK